MADLKVEVVTIEGIAPHENADRLELAKVFGYTCVVGINCYKPGHLAVYFPVDSIIPDSLRDLIFYGGKMKPVSRIRAARIRGVVSQGLLVPVPKIKQYIMDKAATITGGMSIKKPHWEVGKDLTVALGVTKHDPDTDIPSHYKANAVKTRRLNHPEFKKYTKIQHLKRYGDFAFDTGDPVIVTEKIHGRNFRAGWVPTIPRSRVDKVRISWDANPDQSINFCKHPIKWLKLKLSLPRYTFIWGSHNVQFSFDDERHGKMNPYDQCVVANDLPNKIPKGQVWYGEIFGPEMQKGYAYGLKPGEMDVRFFDVMHAATDSYLSFTEAKLFVEKAGMKMVPYWMLKYDATFINRVLNKERMKSFLDPTLDIEGLVIRSPVEYTYLGTNRCILKWIGDAYLLKKGMTEYK